MKRELAASRSSRAGVVPPSKAEWAAIESRGRTSVSGAELQAIRLEARTKRAAAVAVPSLTVATAATAIKKLQGQIVHLQDENARLKVAAMTLVKS